MLVKLFYLRYKILFWFLNRFRYSFQLRYFINKTLTLVFIFGRIQFFVWLVHYSTFDMAVFMLNICKFNGCGITFPRLSDLIEHIEDVHIGEYQIFFILIIPNSSFHACKNYIDPPLIRLINMSKLPTLINFKQQNTN